MHLHLEFKEITLTETSYLTGFPILGQVYDYIRNLQFLNIVIGS